MKKLILTVAILMFCKSLFADSDIHTISLKHRLASEVVDQVRPFLPESATIKAYDNMLILKSELDVPLKSVLVTVWQTSEQLNHQSGHQANIELSTEEPNASVSIKQWSTKGKDDKNNRYSAQGIAGQPIAINIGNARPEKDYLYFVNANGNIGFASNTQYISTSRGFMAVPFLLSDNNVKVEIHPFFSDRSHDGQINSSNLISTVHGKLGQWIEIAYVSEDQHEQKEGLKQYQTHQGQQQIIYLKVETSSN